MAKVLAIFMSRSDYPSLGFTTSTSYRDSAVSDFAFKIEATTGFTPITVAPFYHEPTTGDTTWYHFMWRITTNLSSGDDGDMMKIYDSDGQQIFEFEVNNGIWQGQVLNGITTHTVTGANVPTIKTRMDIKIVVDATDITCSVYVDGDPSPMTVSTLPVNNRVQPARFVLTQQDVNRPTYISELYVAEYDTRNTRPVRQIPNAVGNYTEWNGAYSEIGDDNLATFISSASGGQKLTANITAYRGPASPSGIKEVIIKTQASKSASGPSDVRTMVRIGGVDYFGPNLNTPLDDAGVTYTPFVNNPDTAVPWTTGDIDTTEFGVESIT